MSMRLAMKASLEQEALDEKAKQAAARKLKKQAKEERKAALAEEAAASSAAAEAEAEAEADALLDEATRTMRARVGARLAEVLATTDLEAVKLSSLRKQLEAELGVELAGEHKAWFKDKVTKIVTKRSCAESAAAAMSSKGKKASDLADDEEDPRHPVLSDEMAAVVGIGRAHHFRLTKLLWKYIKAHDLQNPENKNEIRCDEKLKAVFKKDMVTSFGMSKLIGVHMHKDDDPKEPPKKKKAAAASKKRKGDDDDDDGDGGDGDAAPAPKKPRKKPASGGTEYTGSKELAAFAGVRGPRPFFPLFAS